MQLLGNYAVEKLIPALQGQFSFTYKKNTDGVNVATLDIFFLRFEIKENILRIYLIQSKNKALSYKLLITISGDK